MRSQITKTYIALPNWGIGLAERPFATQLGSDVRGFVIDATRSNRAP